MHSDEQNSRNPRPLLPERRDLEGAYPPDQGSEDRNYRGRLCLFLEIPGSGPVRALKRGVKIRVLLDGDNARKSYSIDEWLAGEGIAVRFIEIKRGSLHHKFMLIDAKILITGSYNFTNESEFRNHEAAIFTNNKGLVQSFAAEFERLWSQCAPDESPVQPPIDAEATGAPQGAN